MPRERRIEYAGAVYHALARGDRREPITRDDADRLRWEQTLEEVVVGKCGWALFAWTLMGNHYHLLFQTPEPNLVKGMTWFQNTWTRRFNARHRLWGHLFGGRYKAIPVDTGEGDYLRRLIHYIHLNPVRAGLVKTGEGLESYRWSSLSDYVKPRRNRRPWVAVGAGMEHLGLPDTASGRRQLLQETKSLVDWSHPEGAGWSTMAGQSLQVTLRRGWYFGAESFRESLLLKLGRDDGGIKERRRRGHTGEQARDHGEAVARRIIREAERVFGIEDGAWEALAKGDWRKGMVAGMIRQRALADNGWLAENLHMGARNAVSRTIRQSREHCRSNRQDDRTARSLMRLFECFD